MNYDSTISKDVSLSKVLDEMILDSNDLEVIVQFLRSHEKDIGDIYRHSAFAFELYDVATNPGFLDIPFLIDHMHHLPESSMIYAALCSVAYCRSNSCGKDIISKISSTCGEKIACSSNTRYGLCGTEYDIDVLDGKNTIQNVISNVCKDHRDVSHFLQCSYLVKSAFMMSNFLQFSPSEQFILVNSVIKKYVYSSIYARYETTGKDVSMMCRYSSVLVSLLKQLLYHNQTDMFNWIVSIIKDSKSNWFIEYLKSSLIEDIPVSINKMLFAKIPFEEIVFEMNMYETQFDNLDLFMLIYLCFPYSHVSMIENKELLEFFNLPFELDKLTLFEMNNGSRERMK